MGAFRRIVMVLSGLLAVLLCLGTAAGTASLAVSSAVQPIKLSRYSGPAGVRVTVTGNFSCVQDPTEPAPTDGAIPTPSGSGTLGIWLGDDRSTEPLATTEALGDTFQVEFTVPDVPSDTYTVWASCQDIERGGTTKFAVLASPDVDISPPKALAGETVTLQISDLYCDYPGDGLPSAGGPFQVEWDGYDPESHQAQAATTNVSISVPAGLPPGPTGLTVRCVDVPDVESDLVPFTVAEPGPSSPGPSSPGPSSPGKRTDKPAKRRLTLNPRSARPGAKVTARPIGFPTGCTFKATFDGDPVRLRDLVFTVPRDARPGSHRVVLTCDAATGTSLGDEPVTLAAAIGQTDRFSAEAVLRVLATVAQQAPITASFASPDDLYFDLVKLLVTIVLVAFLVLVTVLPYLVLKSLRPPARRAWDGLRQWRPVLPTPAFTSELVHKALEELVRARKEQRAPRPWLHFAIVVALGAALMTLVDGRVMTDGLGLGVQILVLVAAYALAAAVIVAAYLGIAHRLDHRGNPQVTLHGFLWLREAIVLAVVLAMISYWGEFNPGYVYGVLGFFTLVRHGADPRERPVRMAAEGIAVMVAAWVTTAIAVAAWFFWESLDHAAERTADATGPDLLVGVFVLVVLEAVVFALLPIPMLDGAKLFNWNRAMWALTFIPIAGFFVYLLFTETAGPLDWGEVGMMLGLFALFGALSTLMWYVVWRRIQAEQQAYGHAGAAE